MGNSVEAFRKEWKKTFGKEVTVKAAQDYINWLMITKKQSGGAFAPASLGYDLTAGGANKGSYPEYVSGGFGFANVEQRVASISPAPAPMSGGRGKTRRNRKGQKGGGLWDTIQSQGAAFLARPFTNSMVTPPAIPANPTGMGSDMQMLAKGVGFPSPRPEIPSFQFDPPAPIYAAYVSPSSKTH